MGNFRGSKRLCEKIYSSGWTTLLIGVIFIVAIFSAGHIGKLLVFKLKLALKKEHEEKEAAQKKYLELNAYSQLGLLSHRIAHDLRGLFFILSSYFEMQSESNEEEKEEKKVIIENLQRMKYMITEVTKYGKPSVKEKEIINPVDFLENMVAVARLFEGAEELKFKKDFPDNFKFSIWASRQELQNAFFNIFKNAVEAFGEVKGKKIIEVSVKKIGKKIQIIISDLGIGINEGILKDVFLNPVTTKKDGTGVGLLIIKNAIENNGGTIDIKKRKGHKRYYALP